MGLRRRATHAALVLACAADAHAQFVPGSQPPPAQPGAQPPPAGFGYPAPYPQPPRSRKRDNLEIGVLYATSVAYGVGMGVWFASELEIKDPGVFLIPPAILGVAAPAGVYFLDDPRMDRGLPAATAAGIVIGAGEGFAIWNYQFVTSNEENEWGFRGLTRAMALGSTLGAAGGYALGYYQEPSPKSSAFEVSGIFWGSAIGAMFGYGGTGAGLPYSRANDGAALGGLIGFNLGLAATAGLSTVYIPSWDALGWMWLGAGLGAAVSLPVFLFYAGEDTPPAKRGLLFSGTTTTLGIVAGGLFGGAGDSARDDVAPRRGFASVDYLAPLVLEDGAGVSFGGTLE